MNDKNKKKSEEFENDDKEIENNQKQNRNKTESPNDIQLNQDKLKRGIVAGSVIAGVYFFDYLTADEWYEKDEKGNFVVKRKDLIKEIFD